MRIGETAARAGVPAKTIRFWEDQHLLPEPTRTSSGYRDYEPDVIERLTFIRHAQAAGFALDQIRQVLDIGDAGNPSCEHVAQLIRARLAEVEIHIADLEATRTHLLALADRAAAQDPADCRGYCSILVPPSPGPGPRHRAAVTPRFVKSRAAIRSS
jgi:DNA-binding transcriptional MerR regulator